MANAVNNPTPAGWWKFHLQAPTNTPPLLRDVYESIAAAVYAIEAGQEFGTLADDAADACRRAEPLLSRAADLAHERAMDTVWAVADGAAPVNVRPLVRAVRHQVLDLVAAGDLPSSTATEEPQQRGGRPQNPQKAEIVAFVQNAREAGDTWPAVATKVFDQFGVKYTPDGIRNYVR